MGTRNSNQYHLTIGAAFIDRYLANINEYKEAKAQLAAQLRQHFTGDDDLQVTINAADHEETEDVYLTVNGTSAELGDDGEVGRGNRCNGLITPYRPMSLEAAAGKNPLNHVGKHYNIMARDISKAIVEEELAEQAQVCMVSEIGAPIDEPAIVDVKLQGASSKKAAIRERVNDKLKEMSTLWQDILDGQIKIVV